MKWAIKIFFRSLRVVMGPFILLWEIVTTPKGVVRQPETQHQADLQCRGLILYQFRTCPFCIKVRREIHRLSLTKSRRLQATSNYVMPKKINRIAQNYCRAAARPRYPA